MKLATLGTTLFSISLLVSCGGGGGGGSDSNNNSESSEVSETADTPEVVGTGTITPSNTGSQSAEPLNRLKGRVTFASQFYNSSDVFNDIASFVNIETIDGVRVLFDRNSNTACRVVSQAYEYFCGHIHPSSGNTDIWYFDLNSNGSGEGEWEYCLSEVTFDDCTNELVDAPDGSVKVSVASSRDSATEKLSVPIELELIVNDVDAYKQAGDLQSPSNRSNQVRGSEQVEFSELIRLLQSNLK